MQIYEGIVRSERGERGRGRKAGHIEILVGYRHADNLITSILLFLALPDMSPELRPHI